MQHERRTARRKEIVTELTLQSAGAEMNQWDPPLNANDVKDDDTVEIGKVTERQMTMVCLKSAKGVATTNLGVF